MMMTTPLSFSSSLAFTKSQFPNLMLSTLTTYLIHALKMFMKHVSKCGNSIAESLSNESRITQFINGGTGVETLASVFHHFKQNTSDGGKREQPVV